MRSVYLQSRFFYASSAIILIIALGYLHTYFHTAGVVLLIALMVLTIGELIWLARSQAGLSLSREVHDRLSLGDEQRVDYTLINENNHTLQYKITDEYPYQLQLRDDTLDGQIDAGEELELHKEIRPLSRGDYHFGDAYVYISTPLQLSMWRCDYPLEQSVEVVPSVIQIRKYALQVFSQTATMRGIRKIRAIGESDEFEQIKTYQQGDNYKAINWKATSRQNQLMINQYQNTRSQSVYSIIDMGRTMKMPFDGLTLLDHAINTCLVISNIILRKHDKAGLITFSHEMGDRVAASDLTNQLTRISHHLYNQETAFKESNHESLFYNVRRWIKRRSILFYFTNFESIYDLEKSLHYLKSLSSQHLLVVIIFANTELLRIKNSAVETHADIYKNTMVSKTLMEKELIRNTLRTNGVQCILTRPQDLSVNVINKYLEIKSKRLN